MFFRIIKLYARLAINIYCRTIVINKPEYLHAKGPLLFAANHPNSFLDGIILTTLLEQNLYSLARGDAFKKKKYNKLLRWLHLLPVYRTSEGTENLSHNYTTFAACQEVFADNGLVMIFSEGRCINEWHLRPLRKGTARLAISTWEKGIDLVVVPLGFNYNTFRNFGKNVHIHFGEPLHKEAILQHPTHGAQMLAFNQQLQQQLQHLVYEIPPHDVHKLKQKIYTPQPLFKKIVFALPAVAGWLLHAPLYYPTKTLTANYFNNDHFDSVIASLLMLAYPFYLIFMFTLVYLLMNWQWAVAAFVLLPFCAWACVQLKDQLTQ